MLKSLYIGFMTCLCLLGQGQVLTFNSMSAQRTSWYMRSGCVDNLGNYYAGGDFSRINGNYYYGIGKWDGTKWDSLNRGFYIPGQSGGMSNGARTCAFYNGVLYAGGVFTSIDGKPIRYIARWNGMQWDSLPQSPNTPVDRLVVCKGKLYAFGGFNKIGTTSCNKMATWDGVSWTPIWVPYYIDDIADIAEYKGELYVGGNIFYSSAGSDFDLMKFDGTNWVPVGGGIKGGISFVNSLKVFNNELYIGGYFSKSAGNAGENLMKWDGVQFKEVIGGLDAQINNMTEVPDGLIVTGCFASPFQYVMKISNQGVCGYDAAVFDNCVQGSVYANNKLYFYGGFWTVNGDSTLGYVCNVNYTTQTDSCQAIISGVKNQEIANVISIYPNPTTSVLHIVDEQNEFQNGMMGITNSIGQTVLEIPFQQSIDVSALPEGCYMITVTTKQNQQLRGKFVKY